MLIISRTGREGDNLYKVGFYGARHGKMFAPWSSEAMSYNRATRLKQRIERRRVCVINARIDATGEINKSCSRCGREFWVAADLASSRALDRCGQDDCRPNVQVVILDSPMTAQQRAAGEELAKRVYARAMATTTPAASAESGVEMAAA